MLLADFAGLLFLTLDRLIVSSAFPVEKFAIYSLAVSLLGFVYVFIDSIASVAFPYLSTSSSQLQKKAYALANPLL